MTLITKKQAAVLVDKMYKLAQENAFVEDSYNPNNQCAAEYRRNDGMQVIYNSKELYLSVADDSDSLDFEVRNLHGKYGFRLYLKFHHIFLPFFWKWRRIKAIAKRFKEEARKEDIKRRKQDSMTEFNRMYCESFADEINEIILEDQDDRKDN